jgi:hypothetical protein
MLEVGVTASTIAVVQVDDGDVLSAVEYAAEHGDEAPRSVTICIT